MSSKSQSEAHVEEHSSFIKTPTQLVVVVVLAFAIPIAVILMLAKLVLTVGQFGPDHPAMSEEEIAKRIKPVGMVTLVDPNAPKVVKSGKEVYDQVCAACHAAGVLNAPKVGDKAAWAKLIKEGLDTITTAAIKGVRQMPPRGGNPDLTDVELQRAIVFMANQSGATWKEPEAPAPAQTASAPAAAAGTAAK